MRTVPFLILIVTGLLISAYGLKMCKNIVKKPQKHANCIFEGVKMRLKFLLHKYFDKNLRPTQVEQRVMGGIRFYFYLAPLNLFPV
jgi:hypothetical protein